MNKIKIKVTNEDLSKQIDVVARAVADLTNYVVRMESELSQQIRAVANRLDAMVTDYAKKESHVKLVRRVEALEAKV